jgi:hypothetical protein
MAVDDFRIAKFDQSAFLLVFAVCFSTNGKITPEKVTCYRSMVSDEISFKVGKYYAVEAVDLMQINQRECKQTSTS